MSSIFESNFAQSLEDMINFKTALGHKMKSYKWYLLNFDKFCCEHFPNESILTSELALSWCNATREKSKSGYRFHIIREFGKYLVANGVDAYVIPSTLIPKPKVNIPYILTDGELINFFKATDRILHNSRSPLLEYTIPVIFRLQYACGLRPQEVRLLKVNNFDFEHNTIYIEDSKWCKDRRLSVTYDIMNLCHKYNTIANTIIPNREYFFQSPNGKAYSHGWLTAKFHYCWEMSGNSTDKGSCVPYDLRHNFATRTLHKWVEQKFDINEYIPYLSAYMGHASFSSTFYYIHLLPEKLSCMDFTRCNNIIPEVTL